MITEPDRGDVDEALRHTVAAGGGELEDWRLRSVHRRGTSAVSVVVETDITERGRARTLLYVVHRSRRTVPPGATVLDRSEGSLHVWRFPDDPYIPGLRDAVSRRAARERLERLGLSVAAGVGDPGRRRDDRPVIHTRSYRPTRRAVVSIRPAGSPTPALYIKLMGGATAARVRDRTAALVDVHDHLRAHLPVPRVLEHYLDIGSVTLSALAGTTLRELLRSGASLPTVEDVTALVARIGTCPLPPDGADPARFADVSRHVRLLGQVLPDRATDLARVAAAVAALGGPTGTLHGDLHDGQLLVVDGRPSGLLDVDGAGEGLLAQDVGRLVANVEVAGLTVPAQRDRVDRWAGDLASELATIVPSEHLARAAAGAWLGLATGPHRVRREGWRQAIHDRVDRACAWADRTG